MNFTYCNITAQTDAKAALLFVGKVTDKNFIDRQNKNCTRKQIKLYMFVTTDICLKLMAVRFAFQNRTILFKTERCKFIVDFSCLAWKVST